MATLSLFAPAKLNLFLAVTGRRADGFHELVSVVVPLDFGDTLRTEPAAALTLVCDDPNVPVDGSNLILKAATAYAAARGRPAPHPVRFTLEKRIPMSAGLGGGSSDAVAALRALNRLEPEPLPEAALGALAAQLGSDCPLFLRDGPVVMRGRGEQIEALPPGAAARLRGRRVLVFKPAFGVATAWAYGQLAAAAARGDSGYLPLAEADARVARWIAAADAPAEELLYNNMEPPAFTKFVALPTLLERLRGEFGLRPRMSGSGSACFALLQADTPIAAVKATIKAAWGESALAVEASLT